MIFKQTCAICSKAKISGGSNIDANVITQYKAFVSTVRKKGWKTLNIEDKKVEFICPFCDRRMMKALTLRAAKGEC